MTADHSSDADGAAAVTPVSSLELALAAARAADAKGATDVLVLDVGDEVEAQLRERFGDAPRSVEGAESRRWVLLDYADIVVHVFHAEERDYYRIERLYSDAPKVDWE